MVIQNFNKLICNKWVWGVFALLISVAFVLPDEWLRGDKSQQASQEQFSNHEIDHQLVRECENLIASGVLQIIDSPLAFVFSTQNTDSVWNAYALARSAKDAGLIVGDDVLEERLKALFGNPETNEFNRDEYKRIVKEQIKMPVAKFESYLKLEILLREALKNLVANSQFPNMAEELKRAYDRGDKYTIHIAKFTEDKAKAEKAVADFKAEKEYENKIKDYYDGATNKNNTAVNEFLMPERYKVRSLTFKFADTNYLSKVTVSDDEIKDRYTENKDKGLYDIVSTNKTNNVATTTEEKQVKPLDDVKASIIVELKNEKARVEKKKAIEALENELAETAPKRGIDSKDKADAFIAQIQATKGASIVTNDWLYLEGEPTVKGHAKAINQVFPGYSAKELENSIWDLNIGDVDFISSENAVCVYQLIEKSPSHNLSYDDSKEYIVKKFCNEVKAEAFKKSVLDVAARGVDAVLKSGNVSSNIVVTADVPLTFANSRIIEPYLRKLNKGEISDFISISPTEALIVVCENREEVESEASVETVAEGSKNTSLMLQQILDMPAKQITSSMQSYRMFLSAMSYCNQLIQWNAKQLGYKKANAENSTEN